MPRQSQIGLTGLNRGKPCCPIMDPMGNESNLLAELRRHNLLISLIQHRIIAEAVDTYQVSEDELRTARDQFMRNQNLLDDNMLKKFLAKQGWGEDDFLWQISLPIKISRHCEKNFAQKSEDVLTINTRVFHLPLASNYARLPERTTTLFFGGASFVSYTFILNVDDSVQLVAPQTEWTADPRFGYFSRLQKVNGQQLEINTKWRLPAQRIDGDAYKAFQKWAEEIEASSYLPVSITPERSEAEDGA